MGIIYDDGAPRSGDFNPSRLLRMNPHLQYLKHFQNKLFLSWLSQNREASFQERLQAERELKICERKLVYWSRHPSFSWKEVEAGIKEAKAAWKETR